MPRNCITVCDTISKCVECKYHRIYPFMDYRATQQVELLGVFCLKAEYTKEWCYEARNGDEIRHRLVAHALENPGPEVDIPDWCPRLRHA